MHILEKVLGDKDFVVARFIEPAESPINGATTPPIRCT